MFSYNVAVTRAAGTKVYRVQAKSAADAVKAAKKQARKELPLWGYLGWLQAAVVPNSWSTHAPVVPAAPKPYKASFAGLVSVT